MPAYHFVPLPVPGGKVLLRNIGHTYDLLQMPEKTNTLPAHYFVLFQILKHTFFQCGIGDTVSASPLQMFLLYEKLSKLSHTIPVPEPYLCPVLNHLQTFAQDPAWQTHSPVLLPEEISDMPFQNPATQNHCHTNSFLPACIHPSTS